MKLHAPFEIGPRLLPALRVNGAWVYLEATRSVGAYGKPAFRWTLDMPDGSEHTGDDLCGWEGLQGMFGSLLAFLSAAGEAWDDDPDERGENADLFPPEVCAWARANSDELDCLRVEIEESGAVLIEE